jgi:nucleoside-diphosphate-sugar epimerase
MGSQGYIGQNLIKRLRKDGIDVVGLSSSDFGLFDEDVGIISDAFSIPSGVDSIIYLSQSPYYRQLPKKINHLWGVNVLSPIKVANLARNFGVKSFIYASTGNVYAPSFSPLSEKDPVRRDDWYALSKIHAEECLLNFSNDLEIVCGRIFGVYGPNQPDKLVPNLIKAIQAGLPIKLERQPGADQYGLNISLSYIDDVVDIFTRIATSKLGPSGVINIAGNEVLNIGDIASEIGALLNISPDIHLSENPRKLDLISNNSKLIKFYDPVFTPFKVGIKKTLDL